MVVPTYGSDPATITAANLDAKVAGLATEFNGSIDNDNIKSAAAIAYSKLSLTGSIVNADISASASIADSKLATISTADKVSVAALTKFSNLTTVTGVATDYIVISDTSDSGNSKKALASDFQIAAATQAEMEAGSSTTVYASPGRTQYHPGVAKAWIYFDGTGTPAASASYNFDSSITDNGTGDYTLSLTTDMSGTSWCPVSMSLGASGGVCSYVTINSTGALAAGTIRVLVVRGSSEAAVDVAKIAIACFGDQ